MVHCCTHFFPLGVKSGFCVRVRMAGHFPAFSPRPSPVHLGREVRVQQGRVDHDQPPRQGIQPGNEYGYPHAHVFLNHIFHSPVCYVFDFTCQLEGLNCQMKSPKFLSKSFGRFRGDLRRIVGFECILFSINPVVQFFSCTGV